MLNHLYSKNLGTSLKQSNSLAVMTYPSHWMVRIRPRFDSGLDYFLHFFLSSSFDMIHCKDATYCTGNQICMGIDLSESKCMYKKDKQINRARTATAARKDDLKACRYGIQSCLVERGRLRGLFLVLRHKNLRLV